jgi:RND family efflux transporter MFP subunit
MKNKSFIITIVIILFLAIGLFTWQASVNSSSFQTSTVAVKSISSQISASGTIHSQNEATLHFQTGGKVVYLPYKVGDSVNQGATIAELDTYALQRELTASLNTYRATRDTFDQAQQNAQNGNLQNQQKFALDNSASSPVDNTNVINDIAKRVLDQNQATLDNSVINVELANYAMQLSTLSSPITGVITAEDITVPNINVTPLTSFSIADPTSPIFKANVAESDIDYVTVGADVLITLNGAPKQISGTVTQIEPQKITDATGSYYIVDIQSDDLKQYGKLGQSGNVLIANTQSGSHLLIPLWAVVGHNSVWILEENKPVLKTITTGTTHGEDIEVLSGLSVNDKIIVSPQSVAKTHYSIL